MEIEFDADKNEQNIRERGLSFERAENFDWATALVLTDDRREYGELRYRAFGFLDERLHALVFTVRGDAVRIISLRRANKREIKRYATRTQTKS